MALTGKKRAFADAVLAGFSNKEAAIRAGFSEKTASAAGSRNVKDPDVKAYLEQRRADGGGEVAKVALPPPPADNLVDIPLTDDPMEFLTKLMNEPSADIRIRADVAKAMLPFKHQKLGEGGKKDQKNENAKKVASRFAAAAPPQLKAVK